VGLRFVSFRGRCGTCSVFLCRGCSVVYIGGCVVSKVVAKPKQENGRPSKVSLQRAQKDLNERQLMYVAWQATPEKYRSPKTAKAFAAEMGVTEVTVWRWSKDPRVLEAVRWMVLHHAGDPARVSDVINFLSETALDEQAKMRDRMEAAREYLKAVGVSYAFKSEPRLLKTVDVDEIALDELSNEEVWELYNERAGSNGAPMGASEAGAFDVRAIEPPDGIPDASGGAGASSEADAEAWAVDEDGDPF